MADRRVTKDTLKALADMLGLDLSDDTLDELLPQVQRTTASMSGLDDLDLDSVEPAVTFKADSE